MELLIRCPCRRSAPSRATTACLAFVCLALFLPALARAGQVRGHVLGPDGTPLPGADVALTNDLLGYRDQAVSGADGGFRFPNVPDNPYHLLVSLDGFAPAHVDLDVRGSVPVVHDVKLTARLLRDDDGHRPARAGGARDRRLRRPTSTSTSRSSERFPAAGRLARHRGRSSPRRPASRQDENGRYHFQGGHSQQLLVIDGQTISDQIGITFSNSIDPGDRPGDRGHLRQRPRRVRREGQRRHQPDHALGARHGRLEGRRLRSAPAQLLDLRGLGLGRRRRQPRFGLVR